MAGERWLAIPRPFLERPEVSTAPKFIHPPARRHRLEKVQGGAAGHPQRRCRLFRRPARSAAARHSAGLYHRLGHPQPDPLCRAFRACRGWLSGRTWPVSQGAAEGENRTADRHPELEFRGPLCRRARMEFSRQVHIGRTGPASLLFRLQPSSWFFPAPEDRCH